MQLYSMPSDELLELLSKFLQVIFFPQTWNRLLILEAAGLSFLSALSQPLPQILMTVSQWLCCSSRSTLQGLLSNIYKDQYT